MDKDKILDEQAKQVMSVWSLRGFKNTFPRLYKVINYCMDTAFALGKKERLTPIYDKRRIGNSTRLADYYIQELFTQGFVTIKDHFPKRQADVLLFKKVRMRLEIEHSGITNNNSRIEFDTNRLTIKLKKL